MAAMMSPNFGDGIERVNDRLNRLMNVMEEMEGKISGVNQALAEMKGSGVQTSAESSPRQLPMLSGRNTQNSAMNDMAAALPLFQSIMQGTQPDPQTLLYGLAALLNMKKAPQANSSADRPAVAAKETSSGLAGLFGSNGFVLLLVLILLVLGLNGGLGL